MNCNISWPLQHPAPKVFVHSPRMSDVAATGKRSQMLSGPGPIQFQHLSTGLPKSDCTWLWHPGIPSNFGRGWGVSPPKSQTLQKRNVGNNSWLVHDLFTAWSWWSTDESHVSVLPNSPWQAPSLPCSNLGIICSAISTRADAMSPFRLQEDIGRFQRRM